VRVSIRTVVITLCQLRSEMLKYYVDECQTLPAKHRDINMTWYAKLSVKIVPLSVATVYFTSVFSDAAFYQCL
jgi:hypothetical protein